MHVMIKAAHLCMFQLNVKVLLQWSVLISMAMFVLQVNDTQVLVTFVLYFLHIFILVVTVGVLYTAYIPAVNN